MLAIIAISVTCLSGKLRGCIERTQLQCQQTRKPRSTPRAYARLGAGFAMREDPQAGSLGT